MACTMEKESTISDQECLMQNQAELYYKKSVGLQMKDGISLINKTSLVKGSTVLDLGCGTGNLTAVLAEKVGPTGCVTGIDPNRERIYVAKENITSSNVSFVEADGETFPEDQYDLVLSNYVLHWIEKKEAVFKRVHDNLRPGGQFVFTLCQALPPLYAELLHTLDKDKVEAFTQKLFFVTMNDLEKLATVCGFTVAYQEEGVSRLPFQSFDNALEFLYASATGHVDPSSANKTRLNRLKQKYINNTVEFAEEYASLILVKN